jgi:hypothetical protein
MTSITAQQRRVASSIESLRAWCKAETIEDRLAALGVTQDSEVPPKLTLLHMPESPATESKLQAGGYR